MASLVNYLRGLGVPQPEFEREDDARECIEWSERPYHQTFLEWLNARADRSIPIESQGQVIQSAIEANTFKQVREHLAEIERKAREVIDAE